MRPLFLAGLATLALATPQAHAASVTTIATFFGPNGADPQGGLIADSAGDLFGTTPAGGTSDDGIVFELVNGPSGYTLATLFNFSASQPEPGLFLDSAGNLLGTTDAGTLYELAKGPPGYSFRTLANNFPNAPLFSDGAGNLYGTTQGGSGSVFQLAKGASGYTVNTLVTFSAPTGILPNTGLVVDSAGDVFGTNQQRGPGLGGNPNIASGSAFELVNGASGYTIDVLAAFNSAATGQTPVGGLIADSAGNLFGTT